MAPRLTPAGRGRPTLERLDDRLAPSVTVSLDPVADMFGPQVVTVVARDDSDHAVFGLFDTGASAFGFTTADQDYFTSIGASIPVKVAGGAQAEGIGGTVVGDVSRPGTIFVDGIHAATMIYDQWQIIPRFTFAFGADSAKVGGVQAFLGLAAEAFNSEVPGLTGTPALNPTPAHPAGLAARIDMRAVRLDFSPIFADDFIEVPDLHFVAPGATLAAADGTTEPVRVPLSLVGPDNSAAPGNDVTVSPVPVQPDVALTVGPTTVEHRRFLIDTGSQYSFISTATAEALGLDVARPRFRIPVQGLGDNVVDIPAFALDDLSLPLSDGGTLDFTQALVLVYDVPGDWDGVLGTNAFNTAAAVLYDPFGPGGPSLSASFFTNPDHSVPQYDNIIGFQGPGLLFKDGADVALPAMQFATSALANHPPVLAPTGNQTVNEGSQLRFTVRATDPDGDRLRFSLERGTPRGAKIDPQTGVFTWTPTRGPVTARVTIRVTDSGRPARFAVQTVIITVNNVAPLVKLGPDVTTTAGLPIFSRGSIADPGPGPWHATVDYGDGTGPRALPVGGNKSFHLTHRFTQPGDYTVTVAVTDPDGAAGTASFVVHVVPPVVRRPLTPAARPTGGRR